MKFSEVPLKKVVLCKHTGTSYSSILEIEKIMYSENKKAVYMKTTTGMEGHTNAFNSWRDCEWCDENFEVFDYV